MKYPIIFGVRLKVPNPEHKIAAGQRCRIIFEPAPSAAQPEKVESKEQAVTTNTGTQ